MSEEKGEEGEFGMVCAVEYRSCEYRGRLGHGVSVDAERDSDPFT
jgi:hypothetical protein